MARLPNVREGTLNPASPATQRRQGIADGTHAAVGAQLSPAVRCNVALRGRGVQLGALGGCAAALEVVVN